MKRKRRKRKKKEMVQRSEVRLELDDKIKNLNITLTEPLNI